MGAPNGLLSAGAASEGGGGTLLPPPFILERIIPGSSPRQRYNHFIIRILETGELTAETQQHIAHSTVTMLGNNDFSHTMQVVSFFILKYLIIFGAMDKAHHIGILLDGPGFTQVTQLRTLSVNTFTALHTTIQLTQAIIGMFSSFAKPFNEREIVLTSS